MMEEGYVMSKPLMFKGANYDYWKEKNNCLFWIHSHWYVGYRRKGQSYPLDAQKNEISKDKWTNEHKSKFMKGPLR